ncbi:hypothetical protein LRP30_20235 [Bradyrhizobium sp. C-145]|uniref:hypothetical protein n=1 Tax=Bradyrhizobium sp. C-145 TaxID=574727 RepID=UPI00201B8887|nr:hypothetical protein [Bradyrhizobium sp. C-145]UQR67440.1 hypothetical protein LRP30_20235 [Bradyrhizobium sp. C-145]
MSNVVELQLPDRFENEADVQNIVLLIDMLVVLLAQPDAETAPSMGCTASRRSSRIMRTRSGTAYSRAAWHEPAAPSPQKARTAAAGCPRPPVEAMNTRPPDLLSAAFSLLRQLPAIILMARS